VNADEAARLRQEYESGGLDEAAMADDPFSEFGFWLAGVISVQLPEPNTFVLATANSQGRPSARAVLMKDFSERGIVFYTNLASRKSAELTANPQAAATFVWVPLHRQVRFEGRVEQVGATQADEYFSTRPRGAQIGAHTSEQSSLVASRSELETRYEALAELFGDDVIPRPDTWGGWRLVPESVEFWQGQVNRLHDRVRYRLVAGDWTKERLAP
jgi:pyridoxamine 5'-phosphate oxidase